MYGGFRGGERFMTVHNSKLMHACVKAFQEGEASLNRLLSSFPRVSDRLNTFTCVLHAIMF